MRKAVYHLEEEKPFIFNLTQILIKYLNNQFHIIITINFILKIFIEMLTIKNTRIKMFKKVPLPNYNPVDV